MDDEEKEHKKHAFTSFRAAAGNMCHPGGDNSKDTSSSLTSASQRDIKAQK
jgi:hypothetical protein